MADDPDRPASWLTLPAFGSSEAEMIAAGVRRSHDGRLPPLAIDQRVADARGAGEWAHHPRTGRRYRRSRPPGRLGWT
jgi:hypothetical protein